MLNRSRFTLPGGVTIAQGAQTGFFGFDLLNGQTPASQPSASTQLSGGGPRSANVERPPGVAAEAVGSFIADGAGGGHHAAKAAQGKSRRWRCGDSRRDKAVTQLYRVTARFRSRRGSRPASRKLASGVIAGLRSGAAAAG